MPLKGTFQLVSPAAAATEISNLRLDQDNSHHRGPPIKVQLQQSNLILFQQKSKSLQPLFIDSIAVSVFVVILACLFIQAKAI